MVRNYLTEAGEEQSPSSQQWSDQTPVLTTKQQKFRATQEKFDMTKFQSLQGFEQKINYANTTLKHIGRGQGREVYAYDDKFVLKVAKNDGGIGQNNEEINICNVPGTQGLFPKVAQFAKDHSWIISELAAPMTAAAFPSLTGISWEDFGTALFGAFPSKATKPVTQQYLQYSKQLIQTSKWFANVVNIIVQCHYEPGDIHKLENWGILHGKPVIIDSGFTEAVNVAYYQKAAK